MNDKINASYKVIADHLRSSAFLIADGVMPSNEGRGYVLRRIMRRALLHCHKLNPKNAFFYKLVPTLANEMSKAYPQLKEAEALIIDSLKIEEKRFRNTIDKGMDILNEELTKTKNNKFSGAEAFKLYDTYGFPLDLTENILKEKNIEVDVEAFNSEMQKQKEMARKAWSGSGSAADDSVYFELTEKLGATKTHFYEKEKLEAEIVAIIVDGEEVSATKAGDKNIEIILDQTPFYATSGGQRGDEGIIFKKHEKIKDIIEIDEVVKKAEGLFVHKIGRIQGEFNVGDKIEAQVNRRSGKKRAHSATHLLHYVLRKNFGKQLTQKGSDVSNDSFTFDFNHNEKIAEGDLEQIEDEVNELIAQKSKVGVENLSLKDAKKKGAVALFGEKYGNEVRVLSMADNKSIEFCGGTHVDNLGDIGVFKIISEKSIAAGIRRISAQTSELALSNMKDKLNSLSSAILDLVTKLDQEYETKNIQISDKNNIEGITNFRKQKNEFESKVLELQEEVKKVNKEAEKKKREQLSSGSIDFSQEKIEEISLIHHYFEDVSAKDLRDVITIEKSKKDNLEKTVICFFSSFEGKIAVALAISSDLNNNLNAGKLIPLIAGKIGGKGGGGKPDIAFGGGSDESGIDAALEILKENLK